MNYKLNIAWLYPDLMSTYGDRGNIIVLKKRCQWRNIGVEVVPITLETLDSELSSCDLIFMGGAQDRQQKILSTDFINKKGPIVKKMVEKYIPSLFVCAAYQAVGNFYRPSVGEDIKGAGIIDLATIHPGDQAKRLIGNTVGVLINPIELAGVKIVGFENHGGRTILGKNIEPLAKVLKGFGNDGRSKFEGAFYKNTIASYFHGPILTKNPEIADWLIKKSLAVKYQKNVSLTPLDDTFAKHAKKTIERRLKI